MLKQPFFFALLNNSRCGYLIRDQDRHEASANNLSKVVTGITPLHATAGEDRHLPAHLVTHLLVPGCRMIRMLNYDLAVERKTIANKGPVTNTTPKPFTYFVTELDLCCSFALATPKTLNV